MRILTYHLGRILFAVPFLMFGIGHLTKAKDMVGMVPTWVPGGIFWVYFTGVAMLIAAVSIITTFKARLICILLAVLLLVYIITLHAPHMDQMQHMTALFKDLGLMGAALYLAGTIGNRN